VVMEVESAQSQKMVQRVRKLWNTHIRDDDRTVQRKTSRVDVIDFGKSVSQNS
jgi:hypothetical protein